MLTMLTIEIKCVCHSRNGQLNGNLTIVPFLDICYKLVFWRPLYQKYMATLISPRSRKHTHDNPEIRYRKHMCWSRKYMPKVPKIHKVPKSTESWRPKVSRYRKYTRVPKIPGHESIHHRLACHSLMLKQKEKKGWKNPYCTILFPFSCTDHTVITTF